MIHSPKDADLQRSGGKATVSVVIVTFNSRQTIVECLSSIPLSCEIVLVDQCSNDDTINRAAEVRPDARFVRAGANRGFGAGCNLGAANAEGEVLVFLNPDASFRTPDSLCVLVEAVLRQGAMVGPRVVDTAGNDQTRARYWSNVISDLGEIILPAALLFGKLRRDIPLKDPVYRRGGKVPYVQGSCMAIHAGDFHRAGGFDERYFLYHEEESLARRLSSFAIDVVLNPQAEILHLGAQSTSQLRNFSAGQYYRSLALAYADRLKPLDRLIATFGLWIALRAMAATFVVRSILGYRADKDGSWYSAAARGVVSGWKCEMVVAPSVGAPDSDGVH